MDAAVAAVAGNVAVASVTGEEGVEGVEPRKDIYNTASFAKGATTFTSALDGSVRKAYAWSRRNG